MYLLQVLAECVHDASETREKETKYLRRVLTFAPPMLQSQI